MSSTKDDKRAALWRDMGRASKKIADQFDQKTSLPLLPLEILPSRRVTVGKLLGTGGFNTVHEVTVQPDDPKDKKAKVLARKQLKKTVMEYRDEFYAGAVDLATEAKLLNSLRHKNVITIHGVSHDSFDKAYLNGEQLALYLDRLYGTVDETFDKWRRRYAPREKKQELFRRIQRIALPVAEALKFLHSHHIIFRDIKPSNMGFTADGILKLFDFGLARELDPSLNRKLTGCTGSRRYMAPEVAQALPYGLPADVYSYGVFLYECCELQKPYANMTRSEHFDLVVCGRYRPKFYGTCTPSLQRLICKCWAKAPRVRPNIARVVQALEGELDQENSAPSKEKQGETPSHYIYSFFRWSPMRHNCLHPHEASKESACAA